jgi:hypothetical protein
MEINQTICCEYARLNNPRECCFTDVRTRQSLRLVFSGNTDPKLVIIAFQVLTLSSLRKLKQEYPKNTDL